MEAAYVPQVNDDLDTQNFEKFDEVYVISFLFFFPLLNNCFVFSFLWSVMCEKQKEKKATTTNINLCHNPEKILPLLISLFHAIGMPASRLPGFVKGPLEKGKI